MPSEGTYTDLVTGGSSQFQEFALEAWGFRWWVRG